MSYGKRWWRFSMASLLAVTLASVSAFAAAPATATKAPGPITLEALMAQLQKMPGLDARFVEEKQMALLAEPLVNKGTLHFIAPGRLARHQTAPTQSTMLIEGGKLRFGDASGEQAIDLKTNPVVRLFVESFTTILAGDLPALNRFYELSFKAGAANGADGTEARAWTLTLKPKVKPMNQVITRIELRGRELALDRMVMHEVGGDTTVTRFEAVDTARRYTPAEITRLFRLPTR